MAEVSANTSNRRRARAWSAAIAVLAMLAAVLSISSLPAHATTTLTVTPATTHLVTPNSTTALTGMTISGDTTDNEQATITTDLAGTSISITSHSNVALAYGYSGWTGLQSITFTGLQSDINNALASAELVSGSTTGTAHVSLTATLTQVGYDFLGPNQHFYEYVSCNSNPGVTPACTWFDADAAAKLLSFQGQQGYLATIPDATVNNFVSTKIANAANVWIGARAYEKTATDGTAQYATDNGTAYARVWRWTEGSDESPIAGDVISDCTNIINQCSFSNGTSTFPNNNNGNTSGWSNGEPNDARGDANTAYQGEYVAVTNWGGSSGLWNDIAPDYYNDLVNVHGYVVEFGGKENSDPTYGTGFAGVVTATDAISVASAATAPLAPTITGTRGNASANVTWGPPVDGGAAIDSYQISTDNGLTWSNINPTTTTSLVNGNLVTTLSTTISSLTNGTTYPIKVRAHNSVGYGSASNTANVTPATAPSAPTITASRGDSSATVTWAAPANGGATIDSYQISKDGGSTWTTVTPSLVGGNLVTTLLSLTNGTAYPVQVRAHNNVGYGSASNTVVVTPATVPSTPAAPSAVLGNASATITFSTPASDGGSPITGYLITSTPGSVTVPCGSSPCVINGLTNGTSYTFTIHAINAVGAGPDSLASTAIIPEEPASSSGQGSTSSSGTSGSSSPATPTSSLSSKTTSSCEATSSTTPVDSPVVPGSAALSVDCEDTSHVLSSSSSGLLVTGSGLSLELASAKSGSTLNIDSQSVLTVERDTPLSATVTGFEAGTVASFWVFSTPTMLGQSTVSQGFSATQGFSLPTDLPDGDHTLVVTGTTTDGHHARIAIGFVLTSEPTPTAIAQEDKHSTVTHHTVLKTVSSASPFGVIALAGWIIFGLVVLLVIFWIIFAWRRRRRDDEEDQTV
jgi:hypothetical protein